MRRTIAAIAVIVLVAAIGYGAYRLSYPLEYADELVACARAKALDPALVAALIRAESKFDADAVSGKGAVGLMQLMPSTAQETAMEIGYYPYDLKVPKDNLTLGCAYLSSLMARYGDERTALAAYNAGPGRVDEWIKGSADGRLEEIPYPETRGYVKKIADAVTHYKSLRK